MAPPGSENNGQQQQQQRKQQKGPSPMRRLNNAASAATTVATSMITRRGPPQPQPQSSLSSSRRQVDFTVNASDGDSDGDMQEEADNYDTNNDPVEDSYDIASEQDYDSDSHNTDTADTATSSSSSARGKRTSGAGKGVKKFTKRMLINPIKQVADTAKHPSKLVSRGGSKKPPLNPSPTSIPDGDDVAEHSLLTTIENRAKSNYKGTPDGFRPAVHGEVPPLSVENLGIGLISGGAGGGDDETHKKEFARTKWMETMKALRSQKMISSLPTSSHHAGGRHRRAQTLLTEADNDEEKKRRKKDSGKGHGDDNDFGFFTKDDDGFDAYRKIFGVGRSGGDSDSSNEDSDDDSENGRNEAFLDSTAQGIGRSESGGHLLYGGDNAENPNERLPLLGGDQVYNEEEATSLRARFQRQTMARRKAIQRRWKAAVSWIHPKEIAIGICHWFTHSSMILSLFLFVVAWILYYKFGNPSLDFLPGQATISWWLNFFGRQLLVMELARFCKYIAIDCFVMSTRFVARIFGSWLTYFCIQSKGWPFIVGCWGLLDMLLLHGDNEFQVHWLYWTGIGIYSKANSGSYILTSELYLRVLISMFLVGVITTFKRTILTLYFNRRKFETYKPRLEEILNDIISISDVAELSADADQIAETLGIQKEDSVDDFKRAQVESAMDLRKKKRPTHVRWNSVKFSTTGKSDTGNISEGGSNLDEASLDTGDTSGSVSPTFPPSGFSSFSSSHIAIKELLIKWDEPVNTRDKSYNATVNDILKFRKALTYMDLEYPFSEAFGPAATRDEMIDSAELVYERLLRLSPDSVNLAFSVLQLLCIEDDGSHNKQKHRVLKTLFRPNHKGELTLVSFIQACDTVYKRLRYLRASVGNSSVIDQVLESILNSIFNFMLGLVIFTFLKLNPWSLLVSLSTLLVTASFAVGPTAAKAIEGIVLIVGRRPFDIGDRIIITDSPGGAIPSMGMSFFVEDISLFSTTLRSALTNEVSTISNGSIANARITNCARSKNAIVHFPINFHIKCHLGNLIDKFQHGVEHYIDENPQIWDSIIFFRCDEINTNIECVTYTLCVRSRYSWQIASRVLTKQGELHRYCIDLAYKLKIQFDSPNPRQVLYYGGSLVDGRVPDFKSNVLSNKNIINDHGSSSSERGGSGTLTNNLLQATHDRLTASARGKLETTQTCVSDRSRGSFIEPHKASSIDDKKGHDDDDGDKEDETVPSSSSAAAAVATQEGQDAAGRHFLAMLQESHK